MFGILIFIALVSNVICQDIIGVNYSFDEDISWNFNDKGCENNTRWLLVDYKDVDVKPLNEEATRAIVATENSCTSSFHIVFFPNSILELYVYTKLLSTNSGIVVLVVNEDNKPILKYIYSRSDKDYVEGWCMLKIPIEKNYIGYINLKGYSFHNEIILLDSFKYAPNATRTNHVNEEENEDERTFLNVEQKREVIDKGSEDIEGSGDDFEGSGEDECESDINKPVIEEKTSGLGPWIITLIVVGVVTILVLIAVGSYHLGKLKGQNEIPIFTEEGEPPRVLSIPRVRGTTRSSIYS